MPGTNGVLKTTLSNGLTVVLKETHHAPVTTLWVWYRVGSRNEVPGVTGISHWVEHMMFKGTPTYPKGTIDRIVAREGGRFNAFTWIDFTAYFHTFPAEKIDLALQIESDRMHNSVFDPEEVASERTVIISERQGYENEPMFMLGEEVQAAAFRVHSYHHEVIGDMADLETMTRDQLYQHYQSFYTPNNAIVVVVGDFERDHMLDRIGELFGAVPAGPEPPRVTRTEPVQQGERRVNVQGDGQTQYVQVAYRAPAARSEDFFPVAVLDTILGGASSFTMSGGGGSNRSCRLYQALVATGIAAGASASLMPTIDPYLYAVTAVALTGRTLTEVETAIDAEIKRLIAEPVSAGELEKSIKQTKAQFAYSSESVTDLGFWYGFSELFATHEWFERYIEQLEAVSAEDVQRVAAQLFDPTHRTVGWYVPRTLAASAPAAKTRRSRTRAKATSTTRTKNGTARKTAKSSTTSKTNAKTNAKTKTRTKPKATTRTPSTPKKPAGKPARPAARRSPTRKSTAKTAKTTRR